MDGNEICDSILDWAQALIDLDSQRRECEFGIGLGQIYGFPNKIRLPVDYW